jgi:hypothetical protein
MLKLLCLCGFVHNLSPIPDEGWKTICDKEYERLLEIEAEIAELSREKKEISDKRPSLLKARKVLIGLMYECPECGRIMWQKPGSETYQVFAPEKAP